MYAPLKESEQMNRAHAYPVATKVLFVILVVPLSGLFAYIGYIPFTFDAPDTAMIVAFFLFGAIPIILMLTGVVEIFRCRVTLDDNTITRTGVFGTKTLRLIGIKGYKDGNSGIRLFPRDLNARAINIPYGLSDFDRLKASIAMTVPEIKPDAESDGPALPEAIDPVKEGAGKSLPRAKLITRALNVTSVIAAAWYYFLPSYPSISLPAALCVLLPPAGIALMHFSRQVVDIAADPKSGRPDILITLLAPSFSLSLSFIMFNILNYNKVWPVMTAVFCIILASMSLVSPSIKGNHGARRIPSATMAVIVALMYSFGFTVTTNTILDRSEPQRYTASIVKKYIGSGKSQSTNFVIGPWGPVGTEETIIVPLALYKAREPGDSVTILLKSGLYDIPSYEVTE